MEECNTYSGGFDNRNFVCDNCNIDYKRSTNNCPIYLYRDLALADKLSIILNC